MIWVFVSMERIQKLHGPLGEIFCASGGGSSGKLQDEIGSVFESHFRPGVFIYDGRFSALHEISTHDHEKPVGSGELPGSGEVIGVALVEGIVFGDDTGDFHKLLLLIKNSYLSITVLGKSVHGKIGEKELSSDRCIQKDTYLQLKIGESSDIINLICGWKRKPFIIYERSQES